MDSELAGLDDKKSAHRVFDGMCWTVPSERLGEIEWRFRYATPTRTDLLIAAGALECYRELVFLPERERNKRIREIRKGPNLPRRAIAESGK